MFSGTITSVLREKCHLDPQLPLLIGVSGGPDSLALLHSLLGLGLKLVPAHLDHSLRPESAREADYVMKLTNDWGLECILSKVDVLAHSAQYKQSIEEAARECRYRFLFEHASQQHAQAVVVAHTANDQVETVLMHLLRGAGTGGLRGMTYTEVLPQWSKEIPLFRPMLSIWREEVLAYCETQGLIPVTDQSNLDRTYFRNRIRHELLPILQTYNPQIKRVLWRMADVMDEDDSYLREQSKQAWQKCLLTASNDFVSLDKSNLFTLHKSLQRRVVRQAIGHLRPNLRDIGLEVVDRALQTLQVMPGTGRVDLVTNLDLEITSDVCHIIEKDKNLPVENLPQMKGASLLFLEPDQVVLLKDNWFLKSSLISYATYQNQPEKEKKDPWQAWLAADDLSYPLTVRGRKAGDRFQPLGLNGHSQKLSDFLINQKIPEKARDAWPLVTWEDEILWVAGIRPCHAYRLQGTEAEVLHLRLVKNV